MTDVLTATSLRKAYQNAAGDQTEVLRGIDLQVRQGEAVAIMGPSGSGKTTLLYTLSSMEAASSGQVNFLGRVLSDMSEDALSHLRLNEMGFVFQQSRLLPYLNIFDNIILPGYAAKRIPRAEIEVRARDLLEKVGIRHIAHNEIDQVSGGQSQRATICRALINEPAMLFADEPTGALDSVSAQHVMDIFSDLNRQGATILMVTHDVRVAVRASRTIYLIDGRVRAERSFNDDGSAEALLDRETDLSRWLLELRGDA